MTDPLYRVLGDARHLYRAYAIRLLLMASAVFLPAGAVDVLITVNGGSGPWFELIDLLAGFLLVGCVAGVVKIGLTDESREHPKPAAHVALRSVIGAAILSAGLSAIATAPSIEAAALGHFEFLVTIPAVYLTFMWMLAIPVIVIEDTGVLTALRRSWRLIHGNGFNLLGEAAKAYGAAILIMIVPIGIASVPGRWTLVRQHLLPIAGGIIYGPFAAVALTLIYFRLAQARRAPIPDPLPGSLRA